MISLVLELKLITANAIKHNNSTVNTLAMRKCDLLSIPIKVLKSHRIE